MEVDGSPTQSLPHTLLSSIKTFASQRNLRNAFLTYSLLTTHVSSSSFLLLRALTSLLLPCITVKALQLGELLHAHIVSLGHQQDPVLVPMLVDFYASCGRLSEAHLIVEESNSGNAVPWNVLISACVRDGRCREGIFAYKRMVDVGVKPDVFTYTFVLKACSRECDVGSGWWVHRSIDYGCLRGNLRVQTSLVSMYLKCGWLDVARSLFEKMPVRNVVSWNCMISGYVVKGMWEEALELFERMWVENVEANVVTWNIIATGYLQVGNYKGVLDLISQMRSRGVCIGPVTVLIGLAACSRAEFGKLGKEIHGFTVRHCHDEVEYVKNAMISMYSKCKYPEHAYKLFLSAKEKSVVAWNAMITGFSDLHRFEEAAVVFREMLASGFEPSEVTILSILSICARMTNLQHGRELHCQILRRATFDDHFLFSYNSLVHLYANSGKILEAQRLFDSMDVKDEVAYTSLISGYAMQGMGQTALKLFKEMNLYGKKPDHITMLVVLSACSLSRLVPEGQELFKMMVQEYEITPQMEHFSCMVDLFGRVGLIKEAVKVITEMPFHPSPGIWKSLLVACLKRGNVAIGEWAADNLLELRPHELEVYVLIADMYSLTASWSKLAKVRTLMEPLCMENKDEKSEFGIDLVHQHWQVSHL